MVLCFGLRSAPRLFNMFAEALEYCMVKNGATVATHYLDDYWTCGPPGTSVCQENLDIMKRTCAEIGFALQPEKGYRSGNRAGISWDSCRLAQSRTQNIPRTTRRNHRRVTTMANKKVVYKNSTAVFDRQVGVRVSCDKGRAHIPWAYDRTI